MPLVGGGGAGNVAGGNPSGAGTSINYVRTVDGTFAYAYSGEVSVDNNETTLLSFTTGNETIVGIMRPCYLQSGGDDYEFKIKFNDVLIAYTKAKSEADILAQKYFEIIIPPYTKVEVTGDNTEGSGSINIGTLITGRVY